MFGAASEERSLPARLFWLILGSTVIRLAVAWLLELGNDEVYYWTYAQYPDWSHFDHPPMVGWLISLFTLNGLLTDAFFLRVGPIVIAAINTVLIFSLVKKIADEKAGWWAAVLFNGSIYFSILCGFAILPDAPLSLFWLLSLRLMMDVLPTVDIDRLARWRMALLGIMIGCAVLSKYTGAFIGLGVLVYILFFNRAWLTDWSLYVAGFVAVLVASPILIWNVQNQFISFNFHSNRVDPSQGLRLDYFAREIAGQVAYQNPLLLFAFVPAVLALVRRRPFVEQDFKRILLLDSVPLWLMFTGFSLFRSTLPHWTGPSFLALIILSAVYWSDQEKNQSAPWSKLLKWRMYVPALFLAILLQATVYVINHSPYLLGKHNEVASFGSGDFTQDMYGWKQMALGFRAIAAREESKGSIITGSDLVSFRWFPGAHLDFYVAQPMGRQVYLIGDLREIHKYAWMNEQSGGLQRGRDYYYVAPSNYYRDPSEMFAGYFHAIEPADTIRILRGGQVTRYAFVYLLKNYRGNYENPLKQMSAKHGVSAH